VASVSGASLYAASCTRDALGRIASQTETLGGVSVEKAYAYDLRGRLVSVTTNGVPAEFYAYDLNGSRTNSLAGTAVCDAQDRLLANAAAVFSYDANGALTNTACGLQATAFSYDLFGRLASVSLPDDDTVSYDRDALHRVTTKRVNGVSVKGWIYRNGLVPFAETDTNGVVSSLFVYGTSPFSPDYMVKDGVTYRFVRDFMGSVRLVVNAATGDIAQRLNYDSFGNVLLDTNPGFQPFGFKSGLYDPDTGLVHFGARWYDPETGRWIAKDPILLAGGLNLYAFCGNDPVNFSDPWGLTKTEVIESGEYRFVKYPGDAMHGGAHWHVYARRGGNLLGRVSTSGEVLTGSVPKSALKKLIGTGAFSLVLFGLDASALADGEYHPPLNPAYEAWLQEYEDFYKNNTDLNPFNNTPYDEAWESGWKNREPSMYEK